MRRDLGVPGSELARSVRGAANELGDSYLGGVSSLNEIALSEIGEIRRLRPFGAVERLGAGCRCCGGVILIRLRRRR